MKRLFTSLTFYCLLLGSQFPINILEAQNDLGRPFITNHSFKDYGAGPVNWWAIEDDRGIMYFANGEGVLEYDGANWTIIRAPNQETARSLAKDDNGIIY